MQTASSTVPTIAPPIERREYVPDWWMIALTFGLFLVAVVQAGMFWRQLRIMSAGLRDTRQAADAATQSAIATKASVGLAEDTAERQLRAYVLVLQLELDMSETPPLPDEGKAALKLAIKNWGLTPAYDVRVYAETRFFPRTSEQAGFVDARMPGVPKGTIPPGWNCLQAMGFPATAARKCGECCGGRHMTSLFGRIEYVDTFGVRRYSNFRRVRMRHGHDFVAAYDVHDVTASTGACSSSSTRLMTVARDLLRQLQRQRLVVRVHELLRVRVQADVRELGRRVADAELPHRVHRPQPIADSSGAPRANRHAIDRRVSFTTMPALQTSQMSRSATSLSSTSIRSKVSPSAMAS
jgi:hypothetical protein